MDFRRPSFSATSAAHSAGHASAAWALRGGQRRDGAARRDRRNAARRAGAAAPGVRTASAATGGGEARPSRIRSSSSPRYAPAGRRPARHSKSVAPIAYRSRSGDAGAPVAIVTGSMYPSVPDCSAATRPVLSGSREGAHADASGKLVLAEAIPKSTSLYPSAVSTTFAGLTSRCTIPARCTAER